MRPPGPCALGVLAAFLGGCGSDRPKNITGAYTIAVTYGMNECRLASWREQGESLSGIRLLLNQDLDEPTHVTGTVEGLWGGLLQLWLGSSVFSGTLRGDSLDLEIRGANPASFRSCAYTTNAQARAFVEGDVITGEVTYRHATNGAEDCDYRSWCVTEQSFNGTRPPTQTR